MMLDPFDTPLLPRLASAPELVTDMEEQALIAAIDATDLTVVPLPGLDRQAAYQFVRLAL